MPPAPSRGRAGRKAVVAGRVLAAVRAVDRRAWVIKAIEDAERELAAAKGRTALNAAARKLQRARAELKGLEEQDKPKRPKRTTTRGRDRASS
jgi:hypothetical protein